jgi:hypothetical protein
MREVAMLNKTNRPDAVDATEGQPARVMHSAVIARGGDEAAFAIGWSYAHHSAERPPTVLRACRLPRRDRPGRAQSFLTPPGP